MPVLLYSRPFERVAEYAVQIARALGWNEEQIEPERAALLHDMVR